MQRIDSNLPSIGITNAPDHFSVREARTTAHDAAPCKKEELSLRSGIMLDVPRNVAKTLDVNKLQHSLGGGESSILLELMRCNQSLMTCAVNQRDIQAKAQALALQAQEKEMRDGAKLKIAVAVVQGVMAGITAVVGIAGFKSSIGCSPEKQNINQNIIQSINSVTQAVGQTANISIQYHEGLSQANVKGHEITASAAQRDSQKSEDFYRFCHDNIKAMLQIIMQSGQSDNRAYQSAASV